MEVPHEADILLVEDNPVDAEFTLRALRKANIATRVEHAADGVEALDYLFGSGAWAGRRGGAMPRFVLLDLHLPRMSGLQVLARLRGDSRTRALPVVMLTSSRDVRDISESYRIGANSYVFKPGEYPDLITLLADVVRYWMRINQIAA
jgi:two-component system, response regulator